MAEAHLLGKHVAHTFQVARVARQLQGEDEDVVARLLRRQTACHPVPVLVPAARRRRVVHKIGDDEDKLQRAAVQLLHVCSQIVQHIVQVRIAEILLALIVRRRLVVDMARIVYQVVHRRRAHRTRTAHLVRGLAAEFDDGHVVSLLQRTEEFAQCRHHRLAVLAHRTRHVDGENIVGTLAVQLSAELLHQLRVVGPQGIHPLLLGRQQQGAGKQQG